MQFIFLQENTTKSSSEHTPKDNDHPQRNSVEQVPSSISFIKFRDKSFEWTIILKEEENNADEKENSSEVEMAELPLKVKKSLSHLKATFTFFQEVMIGGAAGTSMSQKVDSSADLYYSI